MGSIGGAGAAWLIAALLLGIAELVIPGVFSVFLAVAAAITGVATLVLPDLPVAGQLAAFAGWSVVAVMIGRRWYRDYPVTGDALLNDRAGRMVGQTGVVETAIVAGHGRLRIGDGAWPARGPALPIGAQVRVVAIDAGIAVVEPVGGDVATPSPPDIPPSRGGANG